MDIMPSKADGGLAVALQRHYARNQRWGFIWAMWLAVLWGAWYVPSTALWYETPYSNIPLDATSLRLAATAVMTWIHAIAVFFFLLLWNTVLSKVSDYGRTIVKFKQISKWYALASLCGGPLAIFGSCLAMFYAGPIFAAISSLLFPVVGAIIAKLWYKEKISSRAALGMAIIIGGGVVIYAPSLFGEVNNAHPQAWIGYLGGAMSALGWGSEGAVAARGMDVSDPDVGIQCRFTFEIIFWSCLILPAIALFTTIPIGKLIYETVTNGKAILWILLASVTHAFCYTSWYKATSLIGVSRCGGIGNLYAVFAILFISAFTLQVPEWYFLVGLSLTIAGSFVMFSEPAESVSQLRDVALVKGSL